MRDSVFGTDSPVWEGPGQRTSLKGTVMYLGSTREENKTVTPEEGTISSPMLRVKVGGPTTRVQDPLTLFRSPKQVTGEFQFLVYTVPPLDVDPVVVWWIRPVTSDTTTGEGTPLPVWPSESSQIVYTLKYETDMESGYRYRHPGQNPYTRKGPGQERFGSSVVLDIVESRPTFRDPTPTPSSLSRKRQRRIV